MKAAVSLRTDHLEAVINYALEQARASCGEVNPLAWGDNENSCGELTQDMYVEDACLEIVTALEGMLAAVQHARGNKHTDLYLISFADN